MLYNARDEPLRKQNRAGRKERETRGGIGVIYIRTNGGGLVAWGGRKRGVRMGACNELAGTKSL